MDNNWALAEGGQMPLRLPAVAGSIQRRPCAHTASMLFSSDWGRDEDEDEEEEEGQAEAPPPPFP